MKASVHRTDIREDRQAATQEVHRATVQAMTGAVQATTEAALLLDPAIAEAVHHTEAVAAVTAEAADPLQEAATAGVHQEVTDDNKAYI